MLKQILMTGAAMIAVPAMAQTTPGRTPMQSSTAQQSTQAPTASTAPTGDAMTAQTSPATPAPTAPADPVVSSQPAAPADATAAAPQSSTPANGAVASTPAQPAGAAQPATAASQVAQIVDREFAAYDKDANGQLSQVEFSAWMVALKTASDPTTKADSPATKQWVGAAFIQADKDKSLALTKTELTGFLAQGQS